MSRHIWLPLSISIFFLFVFALVFDEGFKKRDAMTINERLGTAQFYIEEERPKEALSVYEKIIERYGPIPEAIQGKEKLLTDNEFLR